MAQWDAGTRPAFPYQPFRALYALGEYDEAVPWLPRALDDRAFPFLLIHFPDMWPELRERDDFKDVLAKLDMLESNR